MEADSSIEELSPQAHRSSRPCSRMITARRPFPRLIPLLPAMHGLEVPATIITGATSICVSYHFYLDFRLLRTQAGDTKREQLSSNRFIILVTKVAPLSL